MEDIGPSGHWIAHAPTDMSLLPMVPLLNICKYLEPDDVFLNVARVCKHYSEIINNYQIPMKRLEIGRHLKSVIKLINLKRRISHCKELIIPNDWIIQRSPFWNFAHKQLMQKMRPLLKELEFYSVWKPDMIEFIHSCPKLVKCRKTIYTNELRDGSTHFRCPQVRKLCYEEMQLDTRKLQDVLTIYPNLEELELLDACRNAQNGCIEINHPVPTKLKRLKGNVLLGFGILSQIEELDYEARGLQALGQLIYSIPDMTRLIKLRIILPWEVFWVYTPFESSPRPMYPFLYVALTEKIRESSTITTLIIQGALPGCGDFRFPYLIKDYLSILPERVHTLIYDRIQLRKRGQPTNPRGSSKSINGETKHTLGEKPC
jgi:hypothetical protein